MRRATAVIYESGQHEALHRAQSPALGPLQGPWRGDEASLLAAARVRLGDVGHIRGDLRIPATGEVLAKNVTPDEPMRRSIDLSHGKMSKNGKEGKPKGVVRNRQRRWKRDNHI